jgi:hypothetical protein
VVFAVFETLWFQVLSFKINEIIATNLCLNLILISRQWNLQVRSKPKVPTAAVCAEHLELRREVLNLIQLQKQVLICQFLSKGSSLFDLFTVVKFSALPFLLERHYSFVYYITRHIITH